MRHVPAKLFSELTACPYMDCHLIEKGGVRVEVRPYMDYGLFIRLSLGWKIRI